MHTLNESATAKKEVGPIEGRWKKTPQTTNCRGFVLQSQQWRGGLLPEISSVRCEWFINPTHCLMFCAFLQVIFLQVMFFTGNVFAQQVNKTYTCWKPTAQLRIQFVGKRRGVRNRRSSTLPSRTGTRNIHSVMSAMFDFRKFELVKLSQLKTTLTSPYWF